MCQFKPNSKSRNTLCQTAGVALLLFFSLHANEIEKISADRFSSNPLITFASNSTIGNNINGPSIIRTPSWLENPLGKYYLYFAHHGGKFIRLAYADDIRGPWSVYEPGTLNFDDIQSAGFSGHVASPDVIIDEEEQRIRMYFHAPHSGGGQRTGVALSDNGIDFDVACDTAIGKFYFRVFTHDNEYYAIAKDGNSGGVLCSSPDGFKPFTEIKGIIPNMRHAAVYQDGNVMMVFYSRGGDAPERILVSTMLLDGDVENWEVSEPVEVIRPELDYEGIEYPIKPSKWGSATKVHQLRDPGIYEEDGRVYLFYSIAGEEGIAGAELHIEMKGTVGAHAPFGLPLSRSASKTDVWFDLKGRQLPSTDERKTFGVGLLVSHEKVYLLQNCRP